MNNVRRFCKFSLTAMMFAGLASGCAGTGLYSAGRRPFDDGNKLAAHDPFAGAAKGKRTAEAAGKSPDGTSPDRQLAQSNWGQGQAAGMAPEDYSLPPGPNSQWRPEAPPGTHQTAYNQAPAAPQQTAYAPAGPPPGATMPAGYAPMDYAAAEPAPADYAVPVNNPFSTTTAPQGMYDDAGGFQPVSYAAPSQPAASYPAPGYTAPSDTAPMDSNPFAEVQGQSAAYGGPQAQMSVPPTAGEEFLMPIR